MAVNVVKAETLEDEKLKELIKVCKKTKNYKKLASVSLTLVSNRIDEIGVRMGFRHRKKVEETLFSYMTRVNEIIHKNFNLTLFDTHRMEAIKEYEMLFKKFSGKLPLNIIKVMFEIYFELREKDLPELSKQIQKLELGRSFNFYSKIFGKAPNGNRKGNDGLDLKSFYLYKLRKEERALKSQLQKGYNRDMIEKAIEIEQMKRQLKSNKKIKVKGRLKDNMDYRLAANKMVNYAMLGIAVVCLALMLVILVECVQYPSFTATLSLYTMLFGGIGGINLLNFYMNFRKEGL